MTGIHPAAVEVTGGNLVLVIVVALIALGALAMAAMFRQEVLAAGEGTDNMKNIAQAVQEGADAYLQRQFRTLAIFAVIAFLALLALPVGDIDNAWVVRIFRSVFFLVGALLDGKGDVLHVVRALFGSEDLVAEHHRHTERGQRDQCDDDDQNEVATGKVHDGGMDPGHVYSSMRIRFELDWPRWPSPDREG